MLIKYEVVVETDEDTDMSDFNYIAKSIEFGIQQMINAGEMTSDDSNAVIRSIAVSHTSSVGD